MNTRILSLLEILEVSERFVKTNELADKIINGIQTCLLYTSNPIGEPVYRRRLLTKSLHAMPKSLLSRDLPQGLRGTFYLFCEWYWRKCFPSVLEECCPSNRYFRKKERKNHECSQLLNMNVWSHFCWKRWTVFSWDCCWLWNAACDSEKYVRCDGTTCVSMRESSISEVLYSALHR